MVLPRITISGLRGGSGKTILSVGLSAALSKAGENVIPFKKGPDYIDAGWLALAARKPCHNLDAFLVDPHTTVASFVSHSKEDGISIIEGNRGLYDSIDPDGSTSTAELAKLLVSPLILIVDCTKSTRTMAALVMGCSHFDPDVDLRAVVLNNVAGARHESKLRKNIEKFTGISVIGAIPKLTSEDFPERHMGLIPTAEHDWAYESVDSAGNIAAKYLDLDMVRQIARSPLVAVPRTDKLPMARPKPQLDGYRPRIGVVQDSAFQFYYPENLEALEEAGAEVVSFSLVSGEPIPKLDGLYIGGGFPETHAKELAANSAGRNKIKALADAGLPIYAECGGLMFLGKELVLEEERYPMAGILPIVFGLSKKPQGHGYTVVKVDGTNPYYESGTQLKGHEFHYSSVLEFNGKESDLAFSMVRGRGLYNGRDGMIYKNVLATYTHIHALGAPQWAEGLVRLAAVYSHK
ncbi:hydrogenobyrinic acid a,c-diamide synthase (glutamine-hydrolysing) [Desulfatibacillum alkenivorans DSM 16219]|uniref:Cobyrinate a,c-diamide synthase n=1 Tax=Desulfatibacillum alkenivorans DSM 16219 TaxID=1121393 RepID=A0A1M6KCJ2_9BACT|nr:cobyrinate a,c-diamide synthase [Desulfatibacillum alkenivorans]SHJ56655.1 hydrogenobyrinic acid a,c-diamide synthase (glutamine-hydrolysing) [Desulfatibacillum alkenivorans DSM 16219]